MSNETLSPEPQFRQLVGETLKSLMRQLDVIDPDGEAMDTRISDGVLQVDFEGGGTFILSQQVPVRELWLSARSRAWHFLHTENVWTERDSKAPLNTVLSELFSTRLGRSVSLQS